MDMRISPITSDHLKVVLTTQKLILTGGLIMLVSLPFVLNQLPVLLEFSMFLVVMLDIIAGITSPQHELVALFDLSTSLLTVVFFEYYAVSIYTLQGFSSILLYINELLAIIFFFALYFSVKNLKDEVIEKRREKALLFPGV